MIGEMRTEISTVAPATHEEQISMHHAVEEVHVANVSVVPEIKCSLSRRHAHSANRE